MANNKNNWIKYLNPVNWVKGLWEFLKNTWHFIIESKNEMKRITWPEKSKITKSTGVVISSVFVITLFIWLVDSIFNRGLNSFLNAFK